MKVGLQGKKQDIEKQELLSKWDLLNLRSTRSITSHLLRWCTSWIGDYFPIWFVHSDFLVDDEYRIIFKIENAFDTIERCLVDLRELCE